MAKDYSDLERDLAEKYGMDVIVSDLVPDGVFIIEPSRLADEFVQSADLWRQVPSSPRWEAVQIVQVGLTDVVAWLRANGHHIPSWQQQEMAEATSYSAWRRDAYFAPQVNNPRNWAKITSVL